MGLLESVINAGGKIIDKISPDRAKEREAQARVNELEIGGAPQSPLRLWRSFLGWALACCFLWEVIGRPILATYWPHLTLPPSFLRETSAILLSLLGIGA